jgi:alcohol dehydrogenase class IV
MVPLNTPVTGDREAQMAKFTFETTPKIICAVGSSAELGALVAAAGWRHVFVITDAGLRATGLLEPIEASIQAAGVEVTVFSDVEADPPEAVVLTAVERARVAGVDGVIGIGGGSSMDTAKLVALLLGAPQPIEAIYGIGLAQGRRLPLIQVPTTAGTGSEVTPIAIVTTPSHEKKGVVSPQLLPDLALLDAGLTLSLPPRVTAMTGIDAMVHAIEAYTSKWKKNPVSDSLAIAALKLLFGNIRTVITEPANAAARSAMLEGSLLAGMAFANAPVGAVHALAYPIGGQFHVPHGLSNALVLLPVMRFNLIAARGAYDELASAVLGPGASADTLIAALQTLVAEMPMEQRLSDVGIGAGDLDRLADDALKVQRLLVNNPREVTLADARQLYAEAL